MLACLALRFLELGETKETKISLSGELSWLFSAVFELKFVMSFIADIFPSEDEENFNTRKQAAKSVQRGKRSMNEIISPREDLKQSKFPRQETKRCDW